MKIHKLIGYDHELHSKNLLNNEK